MIEIRPFERLGRTEVPGLEGRHHFCFARYQHPERLQWDRLRIWNDYRLDPGPGRPPAPCDNFDIVTIGRDGFLTRPGTFGESSGTRPGEAQILSTGRGASIGLKARGGRTAAFHEIWLTSDRRNVDPHCTKIAIPSGEGCHLLASGFEQDDAARLTSAARITAANVPPHRSLRWQLRPGCHAYLVPISGSVRLGDLIMSEGSGAAIVGETDITLGARDGAEVILVECGPKPGGA